MVVFAIALTATAARASLIFLYDFPGSPASGLAVDQTNPQPANATFSDFTRTNVNVASNNWFTSTGWNQTSSIDTTQHEGFSITASPGYVLSLTSLTLSLQVENNGPQSVRVGLFLNGSASAYATADFFPTASFATYTFNFPALTNSDGVTSADFRIYGWNASSNTGKLYLDNVATYGTIDVAVPEVASFGPILLLVSCAIFLQARHGKRLGSRSNETMKRITAAVLRKLRFEDWFKSKGSELPATIRLSLSR